MAHPDDTSFRLLTPAEQADAAANAPPEYAELLAHDPYVAEVNGGLVSAWWLNNYVESGSIYGPSDPWQPGCDEED